MILELKHIVFSFSPQRPIFKDLSLSLEEKQIYALMGSNGAGKTTLFNLISGFIKPKTGDIFLYKRNIARQQPYKINKYGIGRTFQDLRLINSFTLKENIVLAMQQNATNNWFNAMLPGFFHRHSNTLLDKKADEIAEQFFLQDVRHALAGEVSYGQQKLLSLACCIANGARLLLLDEAVAGIQPEYRNKLSILIRQLKEQGKTILLIEHNVDFIADIADKIFFLHDGKIATFDNLDTLRKDQQVLNAYI